MQIQDSSLVNPPNPVTPHRSSSPARRGWRSLYQWIERFSPQVSISNKICWGYGIAIGIAVLGTTVGLAIGNHYQREARQQLNSARRQATLLTQLQVAVSDFRPEREFIPVLRDESRFQAARTEFAQRVVRVVRLIEKIQASSSTQDLTTLQPFMAALDAQVENYTVSLEPLLADIDPNVLMEDDVEAIQRSLIDFINGPDYLKLFRYSDELTTLIDAAEQQNRRAETTLTLSEKLRNRIIVGSMVLSMAIAALMALYTSHAIARPIKAVTRVAQQVTENADFSLQAEVNTNDEVGVLANSLNQLIEWMALYTSELKETQTQLIQTEKMSSLGQMVAGIAHEINNPVNFIYGNLSHTQTYAEDLMSLVQLYQHDYPQPSLAVQARLKEIDLEFISQDLPCLLSSMKMGTERIRQLVLTLRNFSRLDEASMKASDLHEGIDSTLLLLNHRLKRGIEVIKDYGDLPLVECYPAQINQVFMNIISNAIDSLLEDQSPSSKRITVQTRIDYQQVIIRISDNGPGIPTAIMNKLFDPFFTTKPVGQGTGLGLAICYQIIETHQGKIQVTSRDGEGAEFAIALPIQAAG